MGTLSSSQSAIDDYELPDEKVIDARPKDKVTSADHTEQKALVLPQELYNKLMRLLKQFAAQNDPEWNEGDNIVPIFDSFCDYMLEEEGLDAP
jgi:hypothetical protein